MGPSPTLPPAASARRGQSPLLLALAEREGFEPSIQLWAVYWFSKPAPSASRPPLPTSHRSYAAACGLRLSQAKPASSDHMLRPAASARRRQSPLLHVRRRKRRR